MRRHSDHQTLRSAFTISALALLAIAVGSVSPATAQDFRGTITGQINDVSGGRLPGAVVTAINAATNVESSTTSNSERR